jgi:hypothetical protein
MRLLYSTLPLIFFLTACGNVAHAPNIAEPIKATVWKNKNQLWVNTALGKNQLLADDGQGYNTAISNDGRWLVIDVAMFSNMQISRLLERNLVGKYEFVNNLSQKTWQLVCEQLAININDLINPRTRFVNWSDDGKSLTLEASAYTVDDGDIIETVTITTSQQTVIIQND